MKAKLKPAAKSYSVYFGGELFDLKHLIGNAYMAEAIYEKSHGKFLCHLPQDFELRGLNPHVIRDQDIMALFEADLAIFNFDGTELDSGTVVEFMMAKFADIPTVILRTDLRAAGDQGSVRHDPWNLMASFYPRTEVVRAASLIDYRKLQQSRLRKAPDDITRLAGQHASATASIICDRLATEVVRALNRVIKLPPAMPKELRPDVYSWLALMPGLKGKKKELRAELAKILERKTLRNLI
ncbi:nucleoside 2-deoxyribosyltransferase [Synoicihabitans lomoniglobus]|uniref:Nucleoside 2-deoxyribosyltransferase n=1 Tax=Synoicihabitans lomoniglobus TaxID=2909285 RepID=A0AAE9ZR82_9BACT|nr:nucleoside 2-deoxyribosyltransferase [Opitutaceae bacterium LMO-M01]WED63750.1 nucleoside 2-deoxyribosyltransferase [Opitutaceae bacterium LMO-M01]